MGNIRELLLLSVAVTFLAITGLPHLSSKLDTIKQSQIRESVGVVEKGTESNAVDVSIVSGEDIIGMVPFALGGQYTLVVDGITIDRNTNINSVNLRGVAGLSYKLNISVSAATGVTTIVAIQS